MDHQSKYWELGANFECAAEDFKMLRPSRQLSQSLIPLSLLPGERHCGLRAQFPRYATNSPPARAHTLTRARVIADHATIHSSLRKRPETRHINRATLQLAKRSTAIASAAPHTLYYHPQRTN